MEAQEAPKEEEEKEEEGDDNETTDSLIDDNDVALRVRIMMLRNSIESNENLKQEYEERAYAPIRDTEGPIIVQTTNLIKQLVHDLKGAEEKLREATEVLKMAELERSAVFKLLDAALEKDNAELAEKNAALELKNLSQ
jgi:hypothetical protein